jgi:hypothetical protein
MKRHRGFNHAVLIGVIAVIGLLMLRGLSTTETFSTDFIFESLLYSYVCAVTALIFLGLGYVLGRQADKLRRLSMTDSFDRPV